MTDLGQSRAAVDLGQVGLELAASTASVSPRVALGLGLADAEDRQQPGLERGRDLLRESLVRLAEELAALGVAEHDRLDAEVGEHRARRPRR